jgi:ribonuclease T
MAFVTLQLDEAGMLHRLETHHCHVLPFKGANLEEASLAVNHIDPYHPFRFALEEKVAIDQMFNVIKHELKRNGCQRAVLVGHNAWFDLTFLRAAAMRCRYKVIPFHAFTTFDTATLAAMAYGETILVKAVKAAGFDFDHNQAHSAIYDAEKTADLFCKIMNVWNASQLNIG